MVFHQTGSGPRIIGCGEKKSFIVAISHICNLPSNSSVSEYVDWSEHFFGKGSILPTYY